MKHIFIINTIAGKGKYVKILPNIEKTCKEQNIEYEIKYITEELDGKSIALEYKNGIFVELKPNLVGLAEYKEGFNYGQKVNVYIKKIIKDKKKRFRAFLFLSPFLLLFSFFLSYI